MWPPVFERAIAAFGWRQTMLWYALAEIVVIVPLAAIYFRHPPEVIHPAEASRGASGKSARARLAAQCGVRADVRRGGAVLHPDGDAAGPSGRLLQRPRHRPLGRRVDAVGAARHRVPVSRQIWGAISDRIGGLATVLIGSAWQAAAMTAFLLTQNEVGLFTIAAAFGLGFSGIIPAYVLALRELFPAAEASWRIPTLLLFSGARHGVRRLARRPALRSFRLLRAGLRRRHRRESFSI